jgi:hypothetical protein
VDAEGGGGTCRWYLQLAGHTWGHTWVDTIRGRVRHVGVLGVDADGRVAKVHDLRTREGDTGGCEGRAGGGCGGLRCSQRSAAPAAGCVYVVEGV